MCARYTSMLHPVVEDVLHVWRVGALVRRRANAGAAPLAPTAD